MAPTEEEVRELREIYVRGSFARDPRVAVVCDSWLAQRDVVAAAQHFLDTFDGERSDGWQGELALARGALRDAVVAAVVSGTPPPEEQT